MDAQNSHIRRLAIGLGIAGLAVILIAGGGLFFFTDAFAPAPPTIVFELPPSLDQLAAKYPEIASVLQDSALGSVYKDFLVAYQQGGLPAAEKLAAERGLIDQHQRVQVTLVLDSPNNAPAVMAEAEQLGIIVEGTYDEFVDVAIPLPLIEQFAKSKNPGEIFHRLHEVKHIVKIRAPITLHVDTLGLFSEGVGTTGAEAWHQAGFTGKGIKIGILDMGFDGYKDLLGRQLPARVTAKSFVSGVEPDHTGEVHGAGCAEIVYAMAPDAELFLAYYNGHLSTERPAVDWLVSQGVQIISHSVGGEIAPMDGTGPDPLIVDMTTAKNIVWVNAMGNEAKMHYRAKADPATDQWLTFPNNSSSLKVTFSAQVKATHFDLRWDDWGGNATQDLNLLIYDEQGTLVAQSNDAQNGFQGDVPYEYIELKTLAARTYLIKVFAKRITRPVIFDLYAHDGTLAYATPEYSISTPADARSALSVGAIFWRNNSLESFSSRGPTADGRVKPELVAPDGVTTMAYRPEPFYGTSAATPHVAGAAALVWSRFPQMSANDVKAYLQSNTVDMGAPGPDTETGNGRLVLPAPGVPVVSAPTASPTFFAAATAAPTALPSATAVPPTTTPTPTLIAPTATSIATTVAVVPPPPASTTLPTPQAVARPPDAQRSDTMTALIAFLGLLMCGGVVASVGGVTMLVWLTRKPQAALPPPPLPVPQRRRPPPPTAPYPAITSRRGSLALVGVGGQRLVVPVGASVVGRAPDSAIYLDQPEISRQHARIFWDGASATVTDLGSTNGTFVNGRRLAPNVPASLQAGDRVSFGGAAQWQVSVV